MPHIVLQGRADLDRFASRSRPQVDRWKHAVLKLDHCWRRADGEAVLVESVVVESSRHLHPVLVIGLQDDTTRIHLWPPIRVERTPAVQRLLGIIAGALQETCGAGPVIRTNIQPETLEGIPLDRDERADSPDHTATPQ